jgi:hypothetical protein
METKAINSALITLLNLYKNALSGYSEEQFSHKQSAEIWSLGQMYEHLATSANFFFLKNIKYCLEQRNGQIGGEKNEWGVNVFKYNSFPPIKAKVPGNAPDPVAQPKENYEIIFEKIIQQLENQQDAIEADAGEYKTMHPVFGWHNAKEWLQSFEMHHRHHLRQKAELRNFAQCEGLVSDSQKSPQNASEYSPLTPDGGMVSDSRKGSQNASEYSPLTPDGGMVTDSQNLSFITQNSSLITHNSSLTTKHSQLTTVMDGLMRRYSERVPDVKIITKALVNQGVITDESEIENDHVAFRTMGVENLGIASFEKIFMHYGYVKRDYFFFESKKLNAYWFSPPEPHFPRIFVSELRVDDLSETAQKIIRKYTDSVKTDPSDSLDLDDGDAVDKFLHSPLWPLPTLEEYKTLLTESEYAAWVIYNRYYLNHYTVSVHNLPEGYNTIGEFDDFVESLGVKLTDAGGRIKISPDGGLLQSSTVAQMVEATFSGGEKYSIAGSYVEFAERRVLPQFAHLPSSEIKREHRRDGFETGNADKIFESTFISQTQKAP